MVIVTVMIVRFSRSAQHHVACHVRLITSRIRAVDHQVILTRSGILRDLDVVMVDVCLTLA